MTTSQSKSNSQATFSLKKVIDRAVSATRDNQKIICSYKSDILEELRITSNKSAIEKLISTLINNAFLAYQAKSINKIILVGVSLDNDKKISISVTCGGRSISFLQKKLIEQTSLVLMEGHKNTEIYSIAKIVKKDLSGKIKVISKPGKGFTIICSFLLN